MASILAAGTDLLMPDLHDLRLILNSRVPLVLVETRDELRFLGQLERLVRGESAEQYRPLYRWAVTDGLQRLDIAMDPQPLNADPLQALRHIRAVNRAGIYALLDFHPYLDDPVHIRLLKDIALRAVDCRQTVVLVSHSLRLPPDLAHLSARFSLQLPDEEQRAHIVLSVVDEWNAARTHRATVDQHAFDQLVRNLAGLSHADVARLARNAIYDDGALLPCDVPAVAKARYELLNQEGLLSFEYDTASFADVGGLTRLKNWLEQRKGVLHDPPESLRDDLPRGLLLLGVQGCGKSLAAKASAGILQVPLLRLDMASLYNKFYGETERNLRESLRQAEVMAPCVLWLDEIEKALSASDNDDGVSRRVLGSFLIWLAEKRSPVFVVATANDISRLPPELVRKGRFDEIFFVDLPSPQVRMDILEIHMRRRGLDPAHHDLARLVAATHGFSGAEIEQGVVAALYSARMLTKHPDDGQLLAEFSRTRPLSVVMAEQVQSLRDWARGRTVCADGIS